MSDLSHVGDSRTLKTLLTIHDLGPGIVSREKVEKWVGESVEPLPILTLAADGYITLEEGGVRVTERGTDTVRRMREYLLKMMNQES